MSVIFYFVEIHIIIIARFIILQTTGEKKTNTNENNLVYDIFAVAITNAIPFVGFGFLDNFIMIVAVCIIFHNVSLCRLLKLLDLSGWSNWVDVEHEVSNFNHGSGRVGQHSVRRHRNRVSALRWNVRPESRLRTAKVNTSAIEPTQDATCREYGTIVSLHFVSNYYLHKRMLREITGTKEIGT